MVDQVNRDSIHGGSITASKPQGRPIVDPKLNAAAAERDKELKNLPHINEAIRLNNEFLDTQPVFKVANR